AKSNRFTWEVTIPPARTAKPDLKTFRPLILVPLDPTLRTQSEDNLSTPTPFKSPRRTNLLSTISVLANPISALNVLDGPWRVITDAANWFNLTPLTPFDDVTFDPK